MTIFHGEKRGRWLFHRVKRGGALAFFSSKGGDDFFSPKKKGATTIFHQKKGAATCFHWSKRGRGVFFKRKKGGAEFFTRGKIPRTSYPVNFGRYLIEFGVQAHSGTERPTDGLVSEPNISRNMIYFKVIFLFLQNLTINAKVTFRGSFISHFWSDDELRGYDSHQIRQIFDYFVPSQVVQLNWSWNNGDSVDPHG